MIKITDPLIEDLKERVAAAGSQNAAAEEMGISPSHISDILSGKRSLSTKKLEELGYEKIVVHVKAVAVPVVVKAIQKAQSEADHLEGIRKKVEPKIKALSRK